MNVDLNLNLSLKCQVRGSEQSGNVSSQLCIIDLQLKCFYKSRKKPTPRQKNLEQFFVTQSIMTQFKLMFVMYASKELHEAINFFEENNDNFHRIYKKMEELLRNQLLRFMDETVV